MIDKKDPRYNTTLYNHINISDNGKPLISNLEYKTLMENLTEDSYLQAKEKFSFEPRSEKMVLSKLERIKTDKSHFSDYSNH